MQNAGLMHFLPVIFILIYDRNILFTNVSQHKFCNSNYLNTRICFYCFFLLLCDSTHQNSIIEFPHRMQPPDILHMHVGSPCLHNRKQHQHRQYNCHKIQAVFLSVAPYGTDCHLTDDSLIIIFKHRAFVPS